MAEAGRPAGSKAREPMSCVPDSMRPFMRIETLLTMKQLAEVLGISYGALRNIRCTKPDELPKPISIGGLLRFRADDVDEWIRSKRPVD